MRVLDFLRRATPEERRSIGALTVVAGFANALLVVVVNRVAGMVAGTAPIAWWAPVAFAAAFAIYFWCDRIAVTRATTVIERLLKQLRLEIVDTLRRSELPVVDRLGRGQLYNVVSRETNNLSVMFPVLVESFQQMVLLAVSVLYLGFLSLPALAVFLLAVGVGGVAYLQIQRDYQATTREVAARQARMLDAVGDLLDGGKELRLNRRRSDAVFAGVRALSAETEALLLRSGGHAARLILITNLVIYAMLAVVAFLFPRHLGGHGSLVYQLVPTLLFCIMPLLRLMAQGPTYVMAAVGLDTVLDLQRRLQVPDPVDPARARELGGRLRDFREIHYKGLRFSWRDAAGEPVFTAGPLDLAVHRGETIFFVGGNGSGKSTTLRLITGLYPAEEGTIEVDGRRLEPGEIAGLREQFTAIFADFHLFDALYGLEGVEPQRVRDLIRDMGLEGKVDFRDGRFTDLQLSTGQRKRLALIAATLEDRPIYVLDEWSAEQDMGFREHFYTQIVPGLKARGKTVLVVTHDERFWHVADRVIRLDLGSVLWDRPGAQAAESA